MYTVVLWGMKETYNRFYNVIKFEEMKGNIKVSGIISLETYVKSIDGYETLRREEITEMEFDYIVIMAAGVNATEIREYILRHNIGHEKIISGEVFGIPHFDFREYVKILQSRTSIISDCCFGGLVYNRLKMQFLSPFINTAVDGYDYIKLLENFEYYLQQPLEQDVELSAYNSYPIGRLGDVCIQFPHEDSFKNAEVRWNRRKKRINYENLLIIMRTDDDAEMAGRFDALPFSRKIGFSSVPVKRDSIFYIPEYHIERKRGINAIWYETNLNGDFWEYVNHVVINNIDLLALMQGDVFKMQRRNIS